MIKRRLALFTVLAACVVATNSFAKTAPRAKCDFNGNYSFFFTGLRVEGLGSATAQPDAIFSVGRNAGVGYLTVKMDPSTDCRSGAILPGGIINCNFGNSAGLAGAASGREFESFIEGGSVFLETDGEGTMLVETNSSNGVCGTGFDALELDVSVVLGGKTALFNSNGEQFAGSGLIPQAGYDVTLTGRADKCFPGQIKGCYDMRFWRNTISRPTTPFSTSPQELPTFLVDAVGDCTICVDGEGAVTGGSCSCNEKTAGSTIAAPLITLETLSEIEGGGYTLGENCQSSTGYLWFVTSSDRICNVSSYMALDFAVADQGQEIIGACDTDNFILNNASEDNAGIMGCAFEGWLQ